MVVSDIPKKTCLLCSVKGAKKRQKRSLGYQWEWEWNPHRKYEPTANYKYLHAKFVNEFF